MFITDSVFVFWAIKTPFAIHNSSNLSCKMKDPSCPRKISQACRSTAPLPILNQSNLRERETDENNLLFCARHSLNVKRGLSSTEKVAVVMTALGSPGTEKIFISSLQQFCAKGAMLPACMLTTEPGECLLVKPPWFYPANFPSPGLWSWDKAAIWQKWTSPAPSFPSKTAHTFYFSLWLNKGSTQPSCTHFWHKNTMLKAAVACKKPDEIPAHCAAHLHWGSHCIRSVRDLCVCLDALGWGFLWQELLRGVIPPGAVLAVSCGHSSPGQCTAFHPEPGRVAVPAAHSNHHSSGGAASLSHSQPSIVLQKWLKMVAAWVRSS